MPLMRILPKVHLHLNWPGQISRMCDLRMCSHRMQDIVVNKMILIIMARGPLNFLAMMMKLRNTHAGSSMACLMRCPGSFVLKLDNE